MYSITGVCKYKEAGVLGCDLLTSKGQNGGAVTFAGGEIFGIYTDVIDHPEHAEKLGMCVKMTEEVVDWVNEL